MQTESIALAAYIDAIVAARDTCARSEDRLSYAKHLAAAAEISAALQNNNREKLLQLVSAEERNFGCSYLSGEAGESAERAFHDFARTIRSSIGL